MKRIHIFFLTINVIIIAILIGMSSNVKAEEVEFNKENYCDYIAEYAANVMYLRQSEQIPQRKIDEYIPINGTYESEIVKAVYGNYQYSPGAANILIRKAEETNWKECQQYWPVLVGEGLVKEKYMREWFSHKD